MLRFYIETSWSASGPWRTARELPRNANGFAFDERVVLSGFDTHMRVRWEGRGAHEPVYSGPAHEAPPLRDLGFVLGLVGDGKPDA
jgi:hypothetical protein